MHTQGIRQCVFHSLDGHLFYDGSIGVKASKLKLGATPLGSENIRIAMANII
jgi:hypothetical protein